ncbi:adenosylcobinamide-phosphate synthase CbiB [Oceanicella actignis]|uniref:Cobalamin biosynthesis protein CobD n=1 Tax=Oceanicella actignis TaxID=1189325 RepID=A0A1M7RZ17_9RHOB|nr:adenosylcobinamide-phosphate synthase CbiB [Oceanicella actignis]SES96134.1 adenosylcobinamide-phosphate synthase [Oceanicella actignis]SHN51418.1 adenosylcobinamide-phosphate synthase [Oceanicella actignis]
MLWAALILDALLGEPEALWRRVPHPAVLMGRMIDALERRWNRPSDPERTRRARGAAAALAVTAAWAALGALAAWAPGGWLWQTLGAAVLLAQRSLVDHVRAVARGLRQGLGPGRSAVAMIVGRDVRALDEAGVARAAIESAAENFSDGVVAPAFWFAVAGLPGMAAYKALNTADSMIGHRNARFAAFGWAAARADDAANWIPARLSGVILCLVGGGLRGARVMLRDARLHRSPNAGWPEAAMAAALGVSLSGPRVYDGRLSEEPFVHPEGRAPGAQDVERAADMLWRGWAALLALALALGV